MTENNDKNNIEKIYNEMILPMEKKFFFNKFCSCELAKDYFTVEEKASVVLVGPELTGKTSFVRKMIGQNYPGMRIGPGPKTDRFIMVTYGENDNAIPDNLPFGATKELQTAYLSQCRRCCVDADVLKNLTIVDTTEILSDENFARDLAWFAEQVDVILLFFDPENVLISRDFRKSIEAMNSHEDKMKIIFNKTETMSRGEVLSAYRQIVFSVSKVLSQQEPPEIYRGSFGDDEKELKKDLMSLHNNIRKRKIDQLIKRAKNAKIHALLIIELGKGCPKLFGEVQFRIRNFEEICKEIDNKFNLGIRDFPQKKKMQEKLASWDFANFPCFSKKLNLLDDAIHQLEQCLTTSP